MFFCSQMCDGGGGLTSRFAVKCGTGVFNTIITEYDYELPDNNAYPLVLVGPLPSDCLEMTMHTVKRGSLTSHKV